MQTRDVNIRARVLSFCGECFNGTSPNLVKSSGWTFGGSTVYRFMGRVLGLLLALIFGTVFTSLIVKVYASNNSFIKCKLVS